MRSEILQICESIGQAGGRGVLVGGYVRDYLLGSESKDYDIEVYGTEPAELRRLLERFAPVNTVGESFAIYKLAFYHDAERFEVDVSIPRRESKYGRGHRGFTIEGDPHMSFSEAARRRDFTINAILLDPLTHEIIDPYGGVVDLKKKTLRAVAADTFIDDSLRVLRAVQLAARFNLSVDAPTAALCRSIDLSDLPHERIWGEVEKLLLLAARPSLGLTVACELGVLNTRFPALLALVGRDVDDAGRDAFTRTRQRLDEAVPLIADLSKERRITVMLAALSLDLDPAAGCIAGDGAQAATGDAPQLTRAVTLLDTLGVHTIAGYNVRGQVLNLIREQAVAEQFFKQREQTTDGDIRRLSRRVDIGLLYRVSKAEALARTAQADAQEWLIECARRLGVEHAPPQPLLMGRHLIEAGIAPGPRMGEILRRVYEQQLDGQIPDLDAALAAARHLL